MRQIVNYSDFESTMGLLTNEVYAKFLKAEIENDMIICNYDDEGYCLFDEIDEDLFEFTGTAK